VIARVGADEPLAATLDRLRRAGRTPYVVDGTTKRELLDSFTRTLGFPDYFGHNLDALADCLRDVELQVPATIVWDHAATFARTDPRTHAAVQHILSTRLPDGVGALQCLR
jgi:RNAse (barnase) inhibitor barstar